MSFLDDLISPSTLAGIRAQVLGYCQAAGLRVTNWRIVGVGKQTFEAVVSTTYAFTKYVSIVTRGYASLDTSTDPGDPDPFDPNNEALAPAAGFLSNYGENTYGTKREGATFATGLATFVNAGPGARTIAPGGLTYTWTGGSPPSPAPTYVSIADASVYTAPDGTRTVPVGGSVTLPVKAQIIGAFASAPTGTLSLTTTLIGCSGTNPSPIVGNDREDAETYREHCREADARLSLGGPSDAYAYLAAKNLDGSVLMNDATPPAPVGITRVQVTEESDTGIVDAYYASASGAAIADDVTAANANIEAHAFAVPDAITFTGIAATNTTIHVAGTAKIKARIGVTAQAVAQGIVASLVRQGKTIPIGGMDQVAGAGVVYTVDLEAYARAGYAGLYDVRVTTPSGASTAIAVGHVPVLSSVAGDGLGSADWVVTVVP